MSGGSRAASPTAAALPELARAPGGPLALSPQNSSVSLTRRQPGAPPGELRSLYPGGRRHFARVFPTDDHQAVALAATGGLPGTGDRSFSPGRHASNNHCITPSGTDANEVLGVTEQIVIFDAPPEVGCGPVSTGEFWIPIANAWWITNTSFEVAPPGYEPSATTPMEDFLTKAETITYIIDSGTARERTYRYRVQDVVKVDTIDEFFPFVFGGQEPWPKPYPVAQFLAKLPPHPDSTPTPRCCR